MNKKLKLEEVKRIELELLDYIMKISHENQVTCFLDGGTLLGAVRHNGFIPWDDDIDVLVPRKQYKKLLALLDKNSQRFQTISMYKNPDYFYPFSKLVDTHTRLIEKNQMTIRGYGICIDIFPLDYLPDELSSRRKFQKKIERYRWITSRSLSKQMKKQGRGLKNFVVYNLANLYGWRRAIKNINSLCESMQCEKTDYACDIVAARKKNFEVSSKCFEKSIYLIFEGKKYSAPAGYDEYLTALYGNYMQLPPIEKRVSNHDFEAYQINL